MHRSLRIMTAALLAASTALAGQPPGCSATAERSAAAWTVKVVPPEGWHFNLQAGASASWTAGGRSGTLEPARAQEREVVFAAPVEAASLQTRLWLCDAAKTACVPARQAFALAPGLLSPATAPAASRPSPPSPRPGTADHPPQPPAPGTAYGFVVDAPGPALEKAAREKRPLMIDFFGIWCPPCNMLDEVVFSSPEFARATERFVKLKLDADRDSSWPLKERYKVGGYPTVVLARPDGSEIRRIVGYRSLQPFLAVVKEALDEQGGARSDAPLGEARILIERAEFDRAVEVLEKARAARPDRSGTELEVELSRALIGRARKAHADAVAAKAGAAAIGQRLDSYVAALEGASRKFPTRPETLEWLDALAGLLDDKKDTAARDSALDRLIRLAAALETDRTAREQAGLEVADLWVSRAEALQRRGDARASKEAWARAAVEYGKALRRDGLDAARARGFNIERASCLHRAGQDNDAERLYRELEGAYPEEFTFFFAHARLLVDTGDLAGAEATVRKALDRSYGDNRLRCVELTGKILHKLGRDAEARRMIEGELRNARLPEDRSNRTHRYHRALEKLLGELGQGRHAK